jgi:desulfoferrodoxin (superoxide reductase-like protein)
MDGTTATIEDLDSAPSAGAPDADLLQSLVALNEGGKAYDATNTPAGSDPALAETHVPGLAIDLNQATVSVGHASEPNNFTTVLWAEDQNGEVISTKNFQVEATNPEFNFTVPDDVTSITAYAHSSAHGVWACPQQRYNKPQPPEKKGIIEKSQDAVEKAEDAAQQVEKAEDTAQKKVDEVKGKVDELKGKIDEGSAILSAPNGDDAGEIKGNMVEKAQKFLLAKMEAIAQAKLKKANAQLEGLKQVVQAAAGQRTPPAYIKLIDVLVTIVTAPKPKADEAADDPADDDPEGETAPAPEGSTYGAGWAKLKGKIGAEDFMGKVKKFKVDQTLLKKLGAHRVSIEDLIKKAIMDATFGSLKKMGQKAKAQPLNARALLEAAGLLVKDHKANLSPLEMDLYNALIGWFKAVFQTYIRVMLKNTVLNAVKEIVKKKGLPDDVSKLDVGKWKADLPCFKPGFDLYNLPSLDLDLGELDLADPMSLLPEMPDELDMDAITIDCNTGKKDRIEVGRKIQYKLSKLDKFLYRVDDGVNFLDGTAKRIYWSMDTVAVNSKVTQEDPGIPEEIGMEWAPSRRADAASKGQLGD